MSWNYGYILGRPYRSEIPTICVPLSWKVSFALLQELYNDRCSFGLHFVEYGLAAIGRTNGGVCC